MSEKEIDQASGIETTGHEWDGIKELNNPLPRWWLWTFYATIIFSIGYMAWYPSIPLIESSTMGISGTTNRSILADELKAVAESRRSTVEKLASTDLEAIRADAELSRFASAGGSSLFKVYCSQCHGSGAAGSAGVRLGFKSRSLVLAAFRMNRPTVALRCDFAVDGGVHGVTVLAEGGLPFLKWNW